MLLKKTGVVVTCHAEDEGRYTIAISLSSNVLGVKVRNSAHRSSSNVISLRQFSSHNHASKLPLKKTGVVVICHAEDEGRYAIAISLSSNVLGVKVRNSAHRSSSDVISLRQFSSHNHARSYAYDRFQRFLEATARIMAWL